MTLSEYVKKKNGVPFGHPHSLRNNLYRSLGAKNFAVFWNFWNPIFSYYLGTQIFRPLKKQLPAIVALIVTFIICGLIHDLVTTIIRQKVSLFFTVWFTLMSIFVLISKKANYDLSPYHWGIRALVNSLIIATCFFVTLGLNNIFKFY